jgi:hypothetical protein
MIPERAYELLAIRRENAANGIGRKKRTPSKKAAKKPSRKVASPAAGAPAKAQPDSPELPGSQSISRKRTQRTQNDLK